MSSAVEPVATLHDAEIGLIAAALAAAEPRKRALKAVETIAASRMAVTVFSASLCNGETMQLERIHSSRPDIYPVGALKSKGGTSWAQQVLREQRVYVGEGPLAMAAAFDDQEQMARAGIRSIVNVPMVVRGRCVGVLNFARGLERITPNEVLIGRLLGVAATAAFVAGDAS